MVMLVVVLAMILNIIDSNLNGRLIIKYLIMFHFLIISSFSVHVDFFSFWTFCARLWVFSACFFPFLGFGALRF